MGERTVRIRKVKGSNPSVSTIQESSFCLARQKSFFVVKDVGVYTQTDKSGYVSDIMSICGNNTFWDRTWESVDPKRTTANITGFDMAEDVMIRFLHMRHAENICDAGCGCGAYSLKLSRYGFFVSGFDIAERAVSLTKELLSENGYPAESFKTADVLSTGYADGCFDAVVARDMIDHMPICQGAEAVNELLRIVRLGGCVLLTLDMTDSEYESEPHIINHDGDYLYVQGKWDGMAFHPYSPGDIKKLAGENRYEILSSGDHGFIVILETGEQTD